MPTFAPNAQAEVSHDLSGVILAGGRARRLGGVDKPLLEVDGVSLLHRSIKALVSAAQVVVVGPQRPGMPDVVWTREEPPGAGPVAALATGLTFIESQYVAVLAADLPGITTATVDRLRKAVTDTSVAEGAVLVDYSGYRQWLIGVWKCAALRMALPSNPVNASLRQSLGSLSIVEVPGFSGESDDVDTPEDYNRI